MAMGQSDGSIILSTKVDTKGIKQGTDSIMSMATKAGAALAAAFSVKKIADFVKASVDAYAEYEQLVGGVETLFKKSADKVMKYANEAYKTAGMSANEYMANVTSFSASLLSSLEGDTEKAAEVANEALVSMSDNANKMGSSMESIVMAFQGFAKGQYMLLDNLKLGYGGTKTEMERLLKDAEAYRASMGEVVDYDISNLADVYTAIGDIQEKLGIAGTTAKEAATTISGSAATMKAAWQNVLVAISGGGDMDTAIENFANSVDIYFDNILPVVEKAINGIGLLIERIAPKLSESVGKAFIKSIPGLINSIYQLIIGAAKGIYQGVVALFNGATMDSVEREVENVNDSIESSAEKQDEFTDSVNETNKALKKTLAGFDDIQILSAGAANNVEGAAGVDDITNQAQSSGMDASNSTIAEQTKSMITDVLAVVEKALVVIGVLLLMFGQFGLGIGFIVAGAVALGVTSENSTISTIFSDGEKNVNDLLAVITLAFIAIGVVLLLLHQYGWGIGFIVAGAAEYGIIEAASGTSKIFEEAAQALITLMGVAGGALIALGIFLLWFGGVVGKGVAIAMIIAGGLLLVGSVTAAVVVKPEDVKTWLSLIMGIAGGALLALGIILCMVGSLPVGVGMIVAGSVALVSAVALNFNAVVDQIKGWVAAIMAIVGAATLAIGIILVCTGVGIAVGIALIAAGALSFITPIALNWDLIVDWVKNAVNAVIEWVRTYGMLILGILLVLSGVCIGGGIKIIWDWLSNSAESGNATSKAIVDWVKEIWGSIESFWDEHIAPIFTSKFWLDLAKKCGNGLINGFENAINGIIGMFEKMINWIVDGLNKISFDVPDWVPAIGGKTFGFNIPKASFGRVSIPRLAQGTVVPPNKEFMAVLGDNTKEHEIVSPISTMKQAFMEAIVEMGGNFGGGNTEVVLEIDGREFGRAVVEQGNRENRRIGTRLVIL